MIQTAWNPNDEPLDRRRDWLGRATLFRGAAATALDDLARRVVVRVRPARTLLIAQDEPADAAYFIVGGRARVVLFGECGRELNLAQLGPGDFFGEGALFDGRAQSTAVVAAEDVVLLRLSREAFVTHAHAHPASAIALASAIHRRLAATHQTVAALAFDPVERRLVRTLERWGHDNGATDTDDGLVLPGRPTHQALAQMTGSSRETITRALSSLTKRGLVVWRGDGMLLTLALLEG
jgi:CRP/FNR family transcriptional regulator, cyclic AMP receptor protein